MSETDLFDLESLRDISPAVYYAEPHKRSPYLSQYVGAIYKTDEDAVYTDNQGVKWSTGWRNGEHIRVIVL